MLIVIATGKTLEDGPQRHLQAGDARTFGPQASCRTSRRWRWRVTSCAPNCSVRALPPLPQPP